MIKDEKELSEKPVDSLSENNDTSSPTISLIKPQHKSIKWSPENELIMVEWCDIAQCYKWLHSKCHTKLANLQAWFTIPAIALSTISGTASFAQASLPLNAQEYAPMAIGTINIMIGISTTIQQYLKISELNESHRISSISWDKFARNIRIELAKDPDERMDAGQFLKICRSEFDRLMETSPNIDEKTIKEFYTAFQGIETEEQKKEYEILQQKRFQELRKPDICNIIVSANESRHHWYKDPTRLNNVNNYSEGNDVEMEDSNEINIKNNSIDEKLLHFEEMLLKQKQKEEEKRKKEEENKKKEKEEMIMNENKNNQIKLLNDYVEAFENNVGRKPETDEIVLNMKDKIELIILDSYINDFKLKGYIQA